MSDVAPAAAAAPASGGAEATNPNPTTEAEVRNSAPAGGAPPAKPRPEPPVTWDEASGRWVSKLKVDGKEHIVPWDDLHRDAQRAKSADKRFEEGKAAKHEALSIKEQNKLLTDALMHPERAMAAWQRAGLDPNKMIAHMQRVLTEEASLTEEQRELRRYRAQEQVREQERLRHEQTERERAEQAAEDAEFARIDGAFHRNIDKLNVPKDSALRGVVLMLAHAAVDDLAASGERMGASQVIAAAYEEARNITRELVAMTSPEELIKLLGPDVVAKLVETHATSALKSAAALPETAHHATSQHRSPNGQFANRHTAFRPNGRSLFGPR